MSLVDSLYLNLQPNLVFEARLSSSVGSAHADSAGWPCLLSPILSHPPTDPALGTEVLSILYSPLWWLQESGAAFLFTDAGVGGNQPWSSDNGWTEQPYLCP